MNYKYPDIDFSLVFSNLFKCVHEVFYYKPSWAFVVLVVFLLLIKEIKNILQEFDLVEFGDKKIHRSRQKHPVQLGGQQVYEQSNRTSNLLPSIRTEIERIRSLPNPPSEPQKTEMLMEALASVRFQLWCESIFSEIFGSQIILLRELEANKEEGLIITKVDERFQEIKAQHKKAFKDWDVYTYLRYLLEAQAIIIDGSNVKITQAGLDFLAWITTTGKFNKIKPL